MIVAPPAVQQWEPSVSTEPPEEQIDLSTLKEEICCTGGTLQPGCLPGLIIDEVGPVALPLLPIQVDAIKSVGSLVHFDIAEPEETVTRPQGWTWSIPSSKFSMCNAEWETSVISPLMAVIKDRLGTGSEDPSRNIRCVPTRIALSAATARTVDGPTSVFDDITEHDDANVLGTLVIMLPGKYDGGQIGVVEHFASFGDHSGAPEQNEGKKEPPSIISKDVEHLFDFGPRSSFGFHYVASKRGSSIQFRPVTGGQRLCIIYDLILGQAAPVFSATNGSASTTKIPLTPEKSNETVLSGAVQAIERWTQPTTTVRTKIINVLSVGFDDISSGFGHVEGDFTSREVEHSRSALRLLCNDTGLDVFLVNMTLKVKANARSQWYRGSSIWEMGDNCQRSITLDSWMRLNGEGDGRFEDKFGVVDAALEDMARSTVFENLESEWCDDESVQPANWNEEATMVRFYRRAAVVLWRKRETYNLLSGKDFDLAVERFCQKVSSNGATSEADARAVSREIALGILDNFAILAKGPVASLSSSAVSASNGFIQTAEDTSIKLLNSLVRLADKELFVSFISGVFPRLVDHEFPDRLISDCIIATKHFGWDGIHEFLVNAAQRASRKGDMRMVIRIVGGLSNRFSAARANASDNADLHFFNLEKCFRAVANSVVALFDASRAPPSSSEEAVPTIEKDLIVLLDSFGSLQDPALDLRCATELLPRVFDGPRGFRGAVFLEQLLEEDSKIVQRFGSDTLQRVLILMAQSIARKGRIAELTQILELVMERNGEKLSPALKKQKALRFKRIADCVITHFSPDRTGYSWEATATEPSAQDQLLRLMNTFVDIEDNVIRKKFALQLLPKVFGASYGSPTRDFVALFLNERGTMAVRLGGENMRRLVLLLAQTWAQSGKVTLLAQLLDDVLEVTATNATPPTPLSPTVDSVETTSQFVRSLIDTSMAQLQAAQTTETGDSTSKLLSKVVLFGDAVLFKRFLEHVLPRLLVGGSVSIASADHAFVPSGLPSEDLVDAVLAASLQYGFESIQSFFTTCVQRALRRGKSEDVLVLIQGLFGRCATSTESDAPVTGALLEVVKSLARLFVKTMIEDHEDVLRVSASLQNNQRRTSGEGSAKSRPSAFVHAVFLLLHGLGEHQTLKYWITQDLLASPNKYSLSSSVVPAIYTLRLHFNPTSTAQDSQIDKEAQGLGSSTEVEDLGQEAYIVEEQIDLAELERESDEGEEMTAEPTEENMRSTSTEGEERSVPAGADVSDIPAGESTDSPALLAGPAQPGPICDELYIFLVQKTVETLVVHPLLTTSANYLKKVQEMQENQVTDPAVISQLVSSHHLTTPVPPMNWRINRQIRCPRRCADCKQLQSFLRHSAHVSARYALPHRRREHLQRELERAVSVVPTENTHRSSQETGPTLASLTHELLTEVRCETVREGTPHALVITKTRRVYEDNWRQWARFTVGSLIGGGPGRDLGKGKDESGGTSVASKRANTGLFVPETANLGALVPADFWKAGLPPTIQSESNLTHRRSSMLGDGSATGMITPINTSNATASNGGFVSPSSLGNGVMFISGQQTPISPMQQQQQHGWGGGSPTVSSMPTVQQTPTAAAAVPNGRLRSPIHAVPPQFTYPQMQQQPGPMRPHFYGPPGPPSPMGYTHPMVIRMPMVPQQMQPVYHPNGVVIGAAVLMPQQGLPPNPSHPTRQPMGPPPQGPANGAPVDRRVSLR
ncbi:hypothetical protein BJ742DRAFT_553464 [Cladochytrium replicatum]|nr:hypothetical protein BJ742DRAFT_553464 [Cladochytrium replicatum]